MTSQAAPIKVLANAAALVDALAAGGPQTPAELAPRIDVPRSSIYRLVEGLEAIGMVETLSDSRVRLTARWLHLADAGRDAMAEWSAAGSVLDDLVARTGQTAYLTVRRGDRAVCIDWRQGKAIGVLVLKPGLSLPLHAGAAGRVLLAFGECERLLNEAPFAPLTPATLVHRDELERDIATTRERGYAVSEGDVTAGIGAVGVPVRDGKGVVRGALSLGGILADIMNDQDELLEALNRASGLLAEQLVVDDSIA